MLRREARRVASRRLGEVDRERLGEVSITECRMRDYGVCSQKETCRCLGKSNGPLS